jgi:phage gp36-like protein
MASYADGSDLVARYDVRVIAELATDNNVSLSRSDTETHVNVLLALKRASGEVEVSLLAGKNYTVAQLTTLTDNSREHLKDIVCTIAMAKLFRRRANSANVELAEEVRLQSDKYLEKLRRGMNLLGIQDDTTKLDAGVISESGPTVAEIRDRNFMSARLAGRYLPATEQAQPKVRGGET